MKRLIVSACLTLALVGLLQASDPDSNSNGGPYCPFNNISYKDKIVEFKTNTYYQVYSINGVLLRSGYGKYIDLRTLGYDTYIVKAYGYSQKIIFTK